MGDRISSEQMKPTKEAELGSRRLPASEHPEPPRVQGFPPLLEKEPRVLILGSLPGAESLRRGEYYGHRRNAFWPIMGRLIGAGPELAYPERVRRLTAAGVALWDVLAAGKRRGSLDAQILPHTEVPNDIGGLILGEPGIHSILFNGRKAQTAFKKYIAPGLPSERGLFFLTLPSTSPAHASRSFTEKLRKWQILEERLSLPAAR